MLQLFFLGLKCNLLTFKELLVALLSLSICFQLCLGFLTSGWICLWTSKGLSLNIFNQLLDHCLSCLFFSSGLHFTSGIESLHEFSLSSFDNLLSGIFLSLSLSWLLSNWQSWSSGWCSSRCSRCSFSWWCNWCFSYLLLLWLWLLLLLLLCLLCIACITNRSFSALLISLSILLILSLSLQLNGLLFFFFLFFLILSDFLGCTLNLSIFSLAFLGFLHQCVLLHILSLLGFNLRKLVISFIGMLMRGFFLACGRLMMLRSLNVRLLFGGLLLRETRLFGIFGTWREESVDIDNVLEEAPLSLGLVIDLGGALRLGSSLSGGLWWCLDCRLLF